jgi:trypsin
MNLSKRLSLLCATAALAIAPAPAGAIVGGTDAKPGEFPSVAHIVIDQAFQCTGTLVTPNHVVTAAHCDSLVPGGIVNVPIGQPGQLIEVRVGGVETFGNDGETRLGKQVYVNPGWAGIGTFNHDVSVVELSAPVTNKEPVLVAGRGEESLWSAGTLATIAGYGTTESGGDQPEILQKAQVPITTDEYAAAAYDSFENQTQIGAGYPQGGVDTCQGDSGGPLYVPNGVGLRLAGDTSYGDGCAEPGKPGIYGRVADTTLREWIRSVAPAAVAPDATATSGGTTTKGKGRNKNR